MSPHSAAHAALAADAYQTYPRTLWERGVDVEGGRYKIVDQVSTASGYQGTLYQHAESGHMVVAHRGSEFDRELLRDGLLADVGMVVLGMNSQASDAKAFTRQAVEIANDMNLDRCQVPDLTVTGHSLGGTLAQISAYRLGLKGETFNAYGAAGLVADIPEGGTQVVNHVRATDFVSAASAHFGQVRVYAPQQDLDALQGRGYANDPRLLGDLRNPLGVAFGIGMQAHHGQNFVSSADRPGNTVINDDNLARYVQHRPMVDKYRRDVELIHGSLALPRNAVDGVIDTARLVVQGRREELAPAPALIAGQCAVQPAAGSPAEPGHPDHVLLLQIRSGVDGVDAGIGRTPDEASERVAASLLVKARENGLQRVDHVLMSARSGSGAGGESMFAVQGALGDPAHLRAHVDIGVAVATPVHDSFRRLGSVPELQQSQLQSRAIVREEQLQRSQPQPLSL